MLLKLLFEGWCKGLQVASAPGSPQPPGTGSTSMPPVGLGDLQAGRGPPRRLWRESGRGQGGERW